MSGKQFSAVTSLDLSVTRVLGQFFVNVTPSSLQQKPVDVWLPAQQRSLADESQELELSCHQLQCCWLAVQLMLMIERGASA